jgi:hypothetical protein
MGYLCKDASRAQIREAENTRKNRAEIVKALSIGDVTRRELVNGGTFSAAGTLAMTNGPSPHTHSQILPSIPTGTPRSPLRDVQPFPAGRQQGLVLRRGPIANGHPAPAAMLLRYDILTNPNNPNNPQTHVQVIPTPNPTPDGVTYGMPAILPDGNPLHPSFNPKPAI